MTTRQPLKILYAGNVFGLSNHGSYYKIPSKLVNGFIREGHFVYPLNDRDTARYLSPLRTRKLGAAGLNKHLLEVVRTLRPDLVILSNCEMVSDHAIEQVRDILPKTKIVYRNVDSISEKENYQRLIRKRDVVDGIFVTTGDARIEEFAGSRSFCAFMPNPLDSSIEDGRSFAAPHHLYDLFFAGQAIRHTDDRRAEMLLKLREQLSALRLGFFGSAFGERNLGGAEFVETIKQSRIGLSIDREDENAFYASDRMTQYLGNGLLTAIKSGKGFERFFSDDEILYFDTPGDLVERILKISADDAALRARAERGWAKAHDLFDCQRVARYIVDRTFGYDEALDTEWSDLFFQPEPSLRRKAG